MRMKKMKDIDFYGIYFFFFAFENWVAMNMKWSGTQDYVRGTENWRIFTRLLERKRKMKKIKITVKANGDYDDNTSINSSHSLFSVNASVWQSLKSLPLWIDTHNKELVNKSCTSHKVSALFLPWNGLSFKIYFMDLINILWSLDDEWREMLYAFVAKKAEPEKNEHNPKYAYSSIGGMAIVCSHLAVCVCVCV